MNAKFLLVAGLLAAATLPACVGPPKVMVNHSFRGDDKTSKLLIMSSGQIDPSTKKPLFNVFVRMCDLNAQGVESTCVDTKIVENVIPGTVY